MQPREARYRRFLVTPLRLTSSAATLCALGFSAVAHAAVLVVSVGSFGHAGTPAAARDDAAVVVDLVEPTPEPEPVTTVTPSTGHAATWPTQTHPYPVPASHDATPHDPSIVHAAAPLAAPAMAAPAVTAADDTPHFTIAIGPAPGESHGSVSSSGTAAPHVDVAAAIPAQLADAQARLVHGHPPPYPAAARADGVEGYVHLELVVGDGGLVETARVVGGIGHGLDEAAVEAVRTFRFTPAMKDGHAVRVRMAWSVQFRLQ